MGKRKSQIDLLNENLDVEEVRAFYADAGGVTVENDKLLAQRLTAEINPVTETPKYPKGVGSSAVKRWRLEHRITARMAGNSDAQAGAVTITDTPAWREFFGTLQEISEDVAYLRRRCEGVEEE